MIKIKKIVRQYYLYPVLFAFNYALFKDLRPADTLWIASAIALASGILICGIYCLVRNWQRAGFITLLFTTWALYYGTVGALIQVWLGIYFSPIHYLLLMIAWTLFFIFLGSRWLWQRIPFSSTITPFLNILFLVLACYSGFQLYRIESHRFLDPPKPSMSEVAKSVKITARPDIYYIILDGYSRQDVLQEIYHFDNSDFIDFLTRHGFFVAGQSRSNYVQTVLSIASSLNMNYLNGNSILTVRRSEIVDMIANNQARTFLEALGYRTVTLSSYFYYTDIANSDIYLSLPKRSAPAYPDTQILNSSIAALLEQFDLLPGLEYRYKNQQAGVVFTLNELGKVASLPGPKFVFTHIVVPHAAYIFNENGPVTPDYLYNYVPGSLKENLEKYPAQIEYLNRLLEKTVDNILKNSTTPPIIILQSDHGSNAYYNSFSAEKTCMRERTAIFNAYYLPGLERSSPDPSITPVNSFRFIFNQYFDTNFSILKDHLFYSGSNQPFQFIDISDRTLLECGK